jgi:heme exporter protein D
VWYLICAIVFNLPNSPSIAPPRSPCVAGANGSATSAVKVVADLTSFGRSHVFLELYHSWFYMLFVCALPLLALVLLNSALLRAVRQSRRRHAPLSASDKKNNDTTVMLIAVVVIFFLCQAPALVSRIIWAVIKDPNEFRFSPSLSSSTTSSSWVTCALTILNSAVNFLTLLLLRQTLPRRVNKCGKDVI